MGTPAPDSTFDYIVIGAGSAGCVLANRLSANPGTSVCVIEAGGRGDDMRIKVPAGILAIYSNPQFDYVYQGTPQPELGGRQIFVNRGKALGGSSAINSMIYIRGAAEDYDEWEAMGCTGWGWKDVLPVFKAMEKNRIGQNPELHGTEGELYVEKQRDPNDVSRMFVKAGKNQGLPENEDFNGPSQLGVGIYDVTQKRGQRFSAYAAYLEPVKDRKNLDIVTGASVQRLVIEEGRVTGVVMSVMGETRTIRCRREVVLSAGAIASPQILLASGIGPAEELRAAGIDCAVDLPGVGKNLADHVDGLISTRSKNPVTLGISGKKLPKVIATPFDYVLRRMGMMTSNLVEAGGFARTKYAGDLPDIQFHFFPGFRSIRGKVFEFGHGFALHTCLLRPKSLGEITLKPGSGGREILIDHNFLSAEEDRLTMVDALKVARGIMDDPAMSELAGVEMAPGRDVQSDDEILDYLRRTVATVFHPVGTCKMGRDPMAVTDPDTLKVTGLDNLRVADASVMPKLIGGNTNAPSMMIGEMAARRILAA